MLAVYPLIAVNLHKFCISTFYDTIYREKDVNIARIRITKYTLKYS